MGWDISFHPISKVQLKTWYFSLVEQYREQKDEALIKEKIIALLDEHYAKGNPNNIDYKKEEDLEQYLRCVTYEIDSDNDDTFDTTHAYFAAVVQGFYNKYYYARGTCLTFLIEEDDFYLQYITPWASFVDCDKDLDCDNYISGNYSGGPFIDYDNVCKLLDDYANNPKVKKDLDEAFEENINIFLTALNYAKEHNLGILEATEAAEMSNIDNQDEETFTEYE